MNKELTKEDIQRRVQELKDSIDYRDVSSQLRAENKDVIIQCLMVIIPLGLYLFYPDFFIPYLGHVITGIIAITFFIAVIELIPALIKLILVPYKGD